MTPCVGTRRLLAALEMPSGQLLGNRVVKAATAEGLSNREGNPSPETIALYAAWAGSGVGTVITGNLHVDRRFRDRTTSMVLDDESDMAGFRRLSHAIRGLGASAWAQLNHAGRQCPSVIARQPVSASATRPPFRCSAYGYPRALTGAEIEQIIGKFAQSARLAVECGFDGVQLHAAHGYLLSSFLSPDLNRRTDEFGGTLAGRSRLLIRTIAAVRAALGGAACLTVKLNCSDFSPHGLREPEARIVAEWCAEAGVDGIEVSGGTYRRMVMAGESAPASVSGQLDHSGTMFSAFACDLAKRIDVPIMLTGGIRTLEQMDQLRAAGIALIGIARPLCVSTTCVSDLLEGRIDDLRSVPVPPATPYPLLGAASPWRRVRRFDAFAAQAWYSEQLVNMAHGRAVDSGLRPARALQNMMARDHAAWLHPMSATG